MSGAEARETVDCEVCGGTGDLFRYWGEGDYLEESCDGCDGSGQVAARTVDQ